MLITDDIIREAIRRTVDNHRTKRVTFANGKRRTFSNRPVQNMMKNVEKWVSMVQDDIRTGAYKSKLNYRHLTKTNNNGKRRDIRSPELYTRLLQHVWLVIVEPLYKRRDPHVGLNCKKGCGITAENRRSSALRRAKQMFYDRRDLTYVLKMDQRQCYKHITPKVTRRALKRLTHDSELIDFGIEVSFCGDNDLPIGTPTSPTVHHIVMLDFDKWIVQNAPWCIRYADDVLVATYTKADASQLYWRIQNFWWYTLGIRAKTSEVKIAPLTQPLDFCGYILHRNEGKAVTDHNKGYTTVRRSTVVRAKRSNNDDSWGAYFGLMMHADAFRLMKNIELKMKLNQLTSKIKINRSMDAPNIPMKDLIGHEFTIYNYELRYDSKTKKPNWIKCLIGIQEYDENGVAAGREKAYEFHGGYGFLVDFIAQAQQLYGKDALLPLEEMEIEQSCGFIFKGSTNQITYIDEYNEGSNPL